MTSAHPSTRSPAPGRQLPAFVEARSPMARGGTRSGSARAMRLLLLITPCALGVTSCGAAPNHPVQDPRMTDSLAGTSVPPNAAPPVLRVALGDALEVVQGHSTLRLPLQGLAPRQHVRVTTPTVLVFGGPQRPLTFPPGLFVALVPMAGHVVEIKTSPHLRALSLDDALALVARLDEAARGAGWARTREPVAPAAVRQTLAAANPDAPYKQLVLRLGRGQDDLYVSIQRIRTASDTPPANGAFDSTASAPDAFVIDVLINNPAVFERFAALERNR